MSQPTTTPGAQPKAIDLDTVELASAIEVLYSMQQASNSLQMGLDQNPVDEGFPDGRPDYQHAINQHIPRQAYYIQELLQSADQVLKHHKEKIEDQLEKLGPLEAMLTRARRSLPGSPDLPSNQEQQHWLRNFDNGQEPGPVWLLGRATLTQPPARPASSHDKRVTELWSGGFRTRYRQEAPDAEAPEVIAAGDSQVGPAAQQAVEEIDY
jgi:hypothetical protein